MRRRPARPPIIATTPYYWTPPPAMVLEHFAQIGAAVSIPFFVYNAPEDMAGTKVTAELCRKLIERLPNFAGVVDLSLDWQFMIELMTDAPQRAPGLPIARGNRAAWCRPAAIGATGMFAPLAGIAPKLVRALYDLCRDRSCSRRASAQEQIAALRQAVKPRRRCQPQGGHARHGARLRRAAAAGFCRSMRSLTRSSSASSTQLRRCVPSRAAGEPHTTVKPPSSTSVCPVIDAACGLAR